MNEHIEQKTNLLHDPDFDVVQEKLSEERLGEGQIEEKAQKKEQTFSWSVVLNQLPPKTAFVSGLAASIILLMAIGFLFLFPQLLGALKSGNG